MHFITLVTVEVPELQANPTEDMAVEEKLKYFNDLQKQNDKNTMLDINIRMLNGLKTEFARQVYGLMYEKMEPYNEQRLSLGSCCKKKGYTMASYARLEI